MTKQALDLGGEDERTAPPGEEHRLLAEPVAGQVKCPGLAVAERKGEHAIEPIESRPDARMADHLEQHLGIRAVAELYPLPAEPVRVAAVVVDLAVENQDITGFRIDPRLVPAIRGDDGEAQVADRDLRVDMDAMLVRSAIGDRTKHPGKHLLGIGTRRGKADQPAHVICLTSGQGMQGSASCHGTNRRRPIYRPHRFVLETVSCQAMRGLRHVRATG